MNLASFVHPFRVNFVNQTASRTQNKLPVLKAILTRAGLYSKILKLKISGGKRGLHLSSKLKLIACLSQQIALTIQLLNKVKSR